MTGDPIGVAIVDDDPGFAAALAELLALEPALIVVGTAGSVAHGVALLADRRVRLALVDVHMPDGGGLRVVEQVQVWDDPPKVVLISANPATPETRRSGLEFFNKHDLDLEALRRVALGAPRR